MLLARLVVSTFSIGMAVLGVRVVSAQNYPSKPVRLVTPAVGGGADFAARLIAPALSARLGQQVIVDNRGLITAEIVAKALPDGYTLLINGSTIWLLPFMRDHVSYDPVRDFSPITLAIRSPNILVVHPSLPAKSVKELIALAKARPGELNFGTSGTGNSIHIAGELFKAMADLNIVRVNYKGAGASLTGVISDQVQLMFPNAASGMPHVKSGRLRALAVTSAEPSALAPGLPTVAASGLPGYESATILGIWAPAATPATLIKRLNQEIVEAINRSDVREKFFNSGAEVVGSSLEQFAATVKSEMARLGTLIRNAGIRDE